MFHGLLEKPGAGGLFHSDWKLRYFVLHDDLVLQYFDPPPSASRHTTSRKLLQPSFGSPASAAVEGGGDSLLGHGRARPPADLGPVQGAYSLLELGLQEAHSEGAKVYIRLTEEVRVAGRAVTELILRVAPGDRQHGVPYAIELAQGWADEVMQLLRAHTDSREEQPSACACGVALLPGSAFLCGACGVGGERERVRGEGEMNSTPSTPNWGKRAGIPNGGVEALPTGWEISCHGPERMMHHSSTLDAAADAWASLGLAVPPPMPPPASCPPPLPAAAALADRGSR